MLSIFCNKFSRWCCLFFDILIISVVVKRLPEGVRLLWAGIKGESNKQEVVL